MRVQSLLLLLAVLPTSTLALKGAGGSVRRGQRRRAQITSWFNKDNDEDDEGDEGGEGVEGGEGEQGDVQEDTIFGLPGSKNSEGDGDGDDAKKGKDGKKAKDDKKGKDGKKKDKEDKKKKKDKKCKKAKGVQEDSKLEGKLFNLPTLIGGDDDDDDDDNKQYCLHGSRTQEECVAARNGVAPAEDKNVVGGMGMEVQSDKSSDEVKEGMGKILRSEIAPNFIGCKSRRRRTQDEGDEAGEPPADGTEEGEEEEFVTVSGVSFGALEEGECATPAEGCSKLDADVKIYYDGGGKPTADDEQEMFDLLGDTVAAHDFSDVGTVTVTEANANTSGGNSRDAKDKGIPAGAVLGGLALLGAGGWYATKKKKTRTARGDTQQSGKPGEQDHTDNSDDSDGHGPIEAIATLIGVSSKDESKKKEATIATPTTQNRGGFMSGNNNTKQQTQAQQQNDDEGCVLM